MFSLSDYTFHLPKHLIAENATHPAHNAKLMIIDQKTGKISAETNFWNIDAFLDERSVLFFNNSRVLRARIPLINVPFQTKENHHGIIKKGEIFFLKHLQDNYFEALVRPGKKFKVGTKIFLENFTFCVEKITESGRIFSISGGSITDCMDKFGELPLPPYIEYSREKEGDYQNFFATKNGSVAAPTASLHFTESLLKKIPNDKCFITLHIGLGTFKTIDTNDIREYEIHSETVEVPLNIFQKIFDLKNAERKIIAVGTTACRTLESLPSLWKNFDENVRNNFSKDVMCFWDNISGKADAKWISELYISSENVGFATRAYIIPGYHFSVIDELITNFHLPESSLLVLVSAMIGQEKLLENYHYAIRENYRFFSFGDGMYIRNDNS